MKTVAKPWVAVAESAKYEDSIIGNRAGFEKLKQQIDEALLNGCAELPDCITQANRIELVEEDSNPELVPAKISNTISTLGCLVLLGLVAFVLFIGFGTLKNWWK